ncbi:hypothetical protein H257_06109 [Aphanomyces astaci]|uniref:RING-type domain-containing protein n=1 Tax=Aphanomyces astaci TaxID=112090 RepID=W4GNL2_APHAT|nr:hypothetical protein H257_06109 [Aphanomyces astaci]ETV80574.1 hypothetical protein H257_06109 [Aphanomyces astaci]|eukprot:XP_009829521.1 hypothetical protein H257_06109 [Aphanomyces astaci]
MKWVQEQLSQCVVGQNGNVSAAAFTLWWVTPIVQAKWNKRAATYWSEDTATAKALAEELGQGSDDADDLVRCSKKNLATELGPKIALPIPTKARARTASVEPTMSLDEVVVKDCKIQSLAPGLISVASCDTDQEESLALKLMRFDPTKPKSPLLPPQQASTNMRFLSLLRNVRRLESQYAETGKHGRMLASTIVELPAFTYTPVSTNTTAPHGAERCAICLCDFTDSQELRVLPCFHTYHSWCIDKWLLGHAKCPVCILTP